MKRRKRKRYGLGTSFPLDGEMWERRQPARVGDLRGDLILPMFQSLVTAGAAAAIAALVWDLRAALVVGVVGAGATWALLLVDSRRSLWRIETRFNAFDVDGDNVVGDRDPPRTVRVDLVDTDRPHQSKWQFLELPLSEAKLVGVARHVEAGQPFSREGMRRVVSQVEYKRLCAALVKGGLLARLPGNRTVLTGSGRALFRRVLEK